MNNEKKLCGAFSSHRIGPCGLVIGHEGLHEVSFRGGMARWNELQCLSQETSKPADLLWKWRKVHISFDTELPAEMDAEAVYAKLDFGMPNAVVNIEVVAVADHVAEVERLTKEIAELKLKVAPECYWDDETRYESAEEYAEEMRLKVGDEFDLQAASYWGEKLRVTQAPRPVRDDDIGGGEYICETIETVRPTFEEYWQVVARAELAESKLSQLQTANEEKARKIVDAIFPGLTNNIGKQFDGYVQQVAAILNGGQQ